MARDWSNLLFSFEGRIPRSEYWWGVGAVVTSLFMGVILAGVCLAAFDALSMKPIGGLVAATLYFTTCIGCLWGGYAVAIKRLHDHGMSGWWVLLQCIPYLGPLVLLVILGFLPGTAGPNRFGPNPNDSIMDDGAWMANANT